MSLWAVLLAGLFAGGASCVAVQGGLLAGLLTQRTAGVGGRRTPATSTARRDDSRNGRTVVRADPDVTSTVDILVAIADAGYLAEPVAD